MSAHWPATGRQACARRAGVMAANAPEDEDSFGVCEQIAMRIAAVDVPLDEPETDR